MSTLTKKQQKAHAFRSKQKAKKTGKPLPEDVPEADLVLEDEGTGPGLASSSGSGAGAGEASGSGAGKKRKRDAGADADTNEPKGKSNAEDLTGGAKGKAKSIGKGKGDAWGEGEEGGEGEKTAKKSKKEIKQRFILFIGNIGFKTTALDVQNHFKEVLEITPQVRLLTDKPTRAGAPPKSRGIAFLELPSSEKLQAALKLHHTTLNSRRINVELTAGGGGSSAGRASKIKERNERVGVQRVRRAEKDREAGVEPGLNGAGPRPERDWVGRTEGEALVPKSGPTRERKAGGRGVGGRVEGAGAAGAGAGGAGASASAAQDAPVEKSAKAQEDASHVQGVADGSVKVRGGRRVKVTPGGKSGARPPPRSRWEPTGANAMPVG